MNQHQGLDIHKDQLIKTIKGLLKSQKALGLTEDVVIEEENKFFESDNDYDNFEAIDVRSNRIKDAVSKTIFTFVDTYFKSLFTNKAKIANLIAANPNIDPDKKFSSFIKHGEVFDFKNKCFEEIKEIENATGHNFRKSEMLDFLITFEALQFQLIGDFNMQKEIAKTKGDDQLESK